MECVESECSEQTGELTPKMYQSLDGEGKVRDVSSGWLEKLGYDKEEVLGRLFFDFIDERDQEKIRSRFLFLKSHGRVENVEIKLRSKSGAVVEVSLNGEVVYDQNGEFKHTLCELKTLHYYVNSYTETLKLLQRETFHRTIADVAWRIASIEKNNLDEYIQEVMVIMKYPLEVLEVLIDKDITKFCDHDLVNNIYFAPKTKLNKYIEISDCNYYALLKIEGYDSYIHLFLNITPFMDSWWNQSLKILQKSIEQGYQRIFELQRRLIIEQHLEFSNDNLRQRIEEEISKRAIKEQSLLQQSKMAAMGEMISNIAHQWRQPINSLGIIVQNLSLLHKHNMLDDESMSQMEKDMTQLIRMMSDTVDSFRNFFKPAVNTEKFTIFSSIKETLCLIEPAIVHENIKINTKEPLSELIIEGFKNEISQVFLNILTNAKDALVANKIPNGQIDIIISCDSNKFGKIVIQDNAGGIDREIIDQIFDPFFTTKETYGTGIGLYMSKMIIENKFKGSITAYNIGDGACFEIILPLI